MTALALHPAARRRLAERMAPVHDHAIVLRPLGGTGPIVGATEQAFIDAILADIASPDWRTTLAARRGLRRGSDAVLELSQPVHRRFHVALYEATCVQPGSPRVDPRKLEGMGLVLRHQSAGRWHGWMGEGARKRGWLPIALADADPAPAHRGPRRTGAAGQLDAMIAAHRNEPALAEEVLPLFAAPQALCAARGRTILYGLIPVASAERSETPPPAPDYGPERGEMIRHLSGYLKDRAPTDMPRAGEFLDPGWAPLQIASDATGADGQLRLVGLFLQQMVVELDALGTGGAARELMRQLAQIVLPIAHDEFGQVTATTTAADFVRAAAPILLSGAANPAGVVMPLAWPRVDIDPGKMLSEAAIACLVERHAAVVPQTPKFDRNSDLYAVRAFVRARPADGCPAKLVWSDYSEPFRILPWWDGDGPALKIALPPMDQLKRIKPSVAFQLPPSLANLLQGNLKKLKDGENPGGADFDIFWLCSFSIPAITICAFIVLNIFLSLFNIVFSWMAFIKLCIPIPRPK